MELIPKEIMLTPRMQIKKTTKGGGNNGGGFLVQIIHHIAGGFVQIIPQTAHGAGPWRY